jgi:S1-C subfamily serine protease
VVKLKVMRRVPLSVTLVVLPLILASCVEDAVQPRTSESSIDANSEMAPRAPRVVAPRAEAKPISAKAETPLDPHAIARRAAPAVVLVACRQSEDTISQGSGFHIGGGYVVTNLHVVAGCSAIGVRLHGGTFASVRAIASYSADDDIAVLAIDDFPTVARLVLADGPGAEPGDAVVVIGNPLGLEMSVSNGIVAARRQIGGRPYVQITAPISPGSSGGPVLDDHGRVIGVATLTRVGGQALNFAVDAATVRSLLPRSSAREIPLAEFAFATYQRADVNAPPVQPAPSAPNDELPFPKSVVGIAFGMSLEQVQLTCTDESNWNAHRQGLRWYTQLQQSDHAGTQICPRAPEPLDFVAASVVVVLKAGQVTRIAFRPTSWDEALSRLVAKYGRPNTQDINNKTEVLPAGKIPHDRPIGWRLGGGFLRLLPWKSPLVLYISDSDDELNKQGY